MQMNSPVGLNALDAQGVVGQPISREDGDCVLVSLHPVHNADRVVRLGRTPHQRRLGAVPERARPLLRLRRLLAQHGSTALGRVHRRGENAHQRADYEK